MTMGKLGYCMATPMSFWARSRWANSGVRLPGRRRGSSSARAAFSRNWLANSGERASSSITRSSSSSGSGTRLSRSGGSSPAARVRTMPSSDQTTWTS